MLRSFRHHRLMHLPACLAVLLLLVAPLISRWNQAPSQEPMCISGPAGSLAAALLRQQGASVPHASHHDGHVAAIGQHPGDHDAARHGDACDYCVLAARLLPWLVLAVLCLLQLRPTTVSTRGGAPRRAALRWAAHGARGPPLSA
ncbi:DUF2946 family protein [Xanthomonas cassavae CFBP 4642]|uniref:DUF2946 family protein n=1 Tax=Xanthomonas cassavae CFBP 4642 TaxID=1219375 RepID=A0ABS8HHN0_9XANT|nr:DUF2946 family protein [Xanthomonas cassavae]MCC4621475.1 DUF2946 family protein [Xanthomonas cassavae CFBP 4642]